MTIHYSADMDDNGKQIAKLLRPSIQKLLSTFISEVEAKSDLPKSPAGDLLAIIALVALEEAKKLNPKDN